MDSFQTIIGWKGMRNRENKNYRSRFVLTRRVIEKLQKNRKKFKKLKNTIMNSFQAKIGWKSMRMIEIKIFVSLRSCPTRNTKFQKNRDRKSTRLNSSHSS